MRVIDPGHHYEVEDADGHSVTQIQFIKKRPHGVLPDELVTEVDGTTNEEVLAVLIDRLDFLYKKLPSEHTSIALQNCRKALGVLQERTEDRKQRGVESKQIA